MNLTRRTLEVLEKTHLMSLATQDAGGVWVSDVIFIYDDKRTLYWIFDPESRHSKAIMENESVAGTITVSTKSKEPNFGIQFSGVAEKIEGPRYDLAIKHFTKRGRRAPLETDDILGNNSWYKLTISKLRLIDEENFDFDSQEVH